MREHLDRLTPEHERRDAVAPMRGHDDEIAAFRSGGIDDRLVGMLVLELDRVERDTSRFCRVDGCAERFSGVGRYARLVLSRRVLDHLRIGREDMKRGRDRQERDFGADPFGQHDAVLDGPRPVLNHRSV
jgi:hypothetical protein